VTTERERPLILVAEDDEDIAALIEYRLNASGYDVVCVGDGESALGEATEREPDLAVLDVMMPRLDGYEVTRRIRRHEAIARMPVILLTARVQETDIERGFEAGADDYLRKPFSPQELRSRVQSVLGRR
jgi:DNA-binding response OmpR family regulator